MKTAIAVLTVSLLSGCAAIVGNVPSMQHCSEVKYTRQGNQITVEAKCQAPIGGGNLPLPL